MAKYSKRPPRQGKPGGSHPSGGILRAWIEDEDAWDYEVMRPDLSVSDHESTFTGLLDADGDEIWREPNPMGFGKDEEWLNPHS